MASNWHVEDNCSSSESESEEHGSSDEEQDDPPYENDDSERDSESGDDETIGEAAREELVLQPQSWLLSKDKKIQYSTDDLPQNVRQSVASLTRKDAYKFCFTGNLVVQKLM